MDKGHGSPWDRGSADSYYMRSKNPHWFPNGTYNDPWIKKEMMTPEQVQDYNQGYEDNERNGHFKDYGDFFPLTEEDKDD